MGNPLIIPTLRKEAPFDGVTAGARSTLRLPLGQDIIGFLLKYEETGAAASDANFNADIDEIRIFVDSQVKQRITGQQLTEDNAYHGIVTPNGRFPILFERLDARTAAEESLLRIGTANVGNITVEIDINGTAVSPVMELSTYRVPVSTNLGKHEVVNQQQYNFTGSGWQEIAITDKRGGESPFKALKSLTLEGSTVTEVEVLSGNEIVWKGDVTDMEATVEAYGKTRQANRFHLDWFVRGRLADLPQLTRQDASGKWLTIDDFRVRVNTSGAGNVNLVTRAIEERL